MESNSIGASDRDAKTPATRGNAAVIALLILVVIGGFVFYLLRTPELEAPTPRSDSTSSPSAQESAAEPGAAREEERREEASGLTSAESSEGALATESLPDTVRIHGVVLDANGAPFPGVVIRVHARAVEMSALVRETGQFLTGGVVSGDPALRLTTGDEGEFEFPWSPEPGRPVAFVTFDGEGPGLRAVERVVPRPHRLEERVEVTLRPQIAVVGHVRTSDGEPAAGMKVVAWPRGDAEAAVVSEVGVASRPAEVRSARNGESDAEGRFVIVGLSEGEYSFSAESNGTSYVTTPRREQVVAQLAFDEWPPRIELRVELGGVVRGTVSNLDGDPIEGARLSLVPTQLMQFAFDGEFERFEDIGRSKGTTDASGRYEIRGVPLDLEFFAVATHDDWADSASDHFELTRTERERSDLDLFLTLGATVVGLVVGEDGHPVPDAEVSMSPLFTELMSGKASWTSENTQTDGEGRFSFEHIPAGKVQVVAGQANLLQLRTDDPSAVQLEIEGEEVHEVRLVLGADPEGPGGEIRGVVVDRTGAGIPGARLTANGMATGQPVFASATTDDAGSFVLTEVGTGQLFVQIEAEGFASQHATVVPSEQEEIFRLERCGGIRGRVVTHDGQIPVNVRVAYRHVDGDTDVLEMTERMQRSFSEDDDTVRVQADGSFELTEIAPGEVVVSASADGYSTGESAPVVVTAEQLSSGVEVFLGAGCTVFGVVLDAGGIPISGARVSLRRRGATEAEDFMAQLMPGMASEGKTATTGPAGEYEIANLPPGQYVVQASHSTLAASAPLDFVIEDHATLELDPLQLTRGGTIEGRLVTADGDPRSGLFVQLMSKTSGMKMANSDREGRFKWSSLPPGNYLMTITDMAAMQSGQMKIKTATVTIEGSEVHEVEVVFGGGFKVKGKVDGRTLSNMQPVYLLKRDGTTTADLNPLDLDSQHILYRSLIGFGMVSNGEYVIEDVEPGDYVIEIPAMPENPMDMAGYAEMDRTPVYRREVTVRASDTTHDIHLRPEN